MTLATLHHNLNEVLVLAAGTLPKHYKLTLVARNTNPKFKDADVVLTDDDPTLAIAAINKLKDRDAFAPPAKYWIVTVAGWGTAYLFGTESQVEEWRAHKANWERGIGRKRLATEEEIKTHKFRNL